ncbi:uroporphyrinogen-III C-methyltransferase [Halomonas urumqiensis]|uniref:Heme biosynthesis operon protein HemX n=1 Tax=Halomonas urumqiensis TaxID=1684789 RepID=A0A2N7UNX6_9GAMM|nr:uroporphyrinogen-III C-methyltransferase [Halomonas urumqiensis]PMR82147.1 hypothetical protein C1H70_02810 [Halomonas urumqiensis]PTB02522.1 hypothetical protein C6V82_07655 [Halomonas urumqiensis]
MSKQPHDQDEQQTPSGTDSATSGSSGKGNASSRRRSRRYDKAGGTAKGDAVASQSGSGQSSPGESRVSEDKPTTGSTPGGSPGRADAAKPSTSQSSGASTDAAKPTTGTATDTSVGKSSSQSSPSDKPSASGSDKSAANSPGKASSGSADRPAPKAASGGVGKATTTPAGGGDGKGGGKAGIVALVLVILLAVGVLVFGWQAWQKFDAQQARLSELEARTSEAATASQLSELETRLDEGESERDAELEGALGELRDEFSSYRSEVDDALDRVLAELSSEQETDERDWLHAEAAYLLRLANQRLQLEGDVMGSAALLRTADQRLREADNPALVPVRREIAADLAALDAVPQIDRTGLWLTLNAQQEQIAGQPLSQDIEEITVRSSMEEAPEGAWQQQLSRFGQELKDLVTVRQHNAELEALITPEQESYLRQSVRLVIEQAQLALLKEEQELFEASIDKALTLIDGYYDTDASGVQSVVERLQALKSEAISPELPDISGSQQALAAFIERRFESRQGDDA